MMFDPRMQRPMQQMGGQTFVPDSAMGDAGAMGRPMGPNGNTGIVPPHMQRMMLGGQMPAQGFAPGYGQPMAGAMPAYAGAQGPWQNRLAMMLGRY
jgi:hypothetical protein